MDRKAVEVFIILDFKVSHKGRVVPWSTIDLKKRTLLCEAGIHFISLYWAIPIHKITRSILDKIDMCAKQISILIIHTVNSIQHATTSFT